MALQGGRNTPDDQGEAAEEMDVRHGTVARRLRLGGVPQPPLQRFDAGCPLPPKMCLPQPSRTVVVRWLAGGFGFGRRALLQRDGGRRLLMPPWP